MNFRKMFALMALAATVSGAAVAEEKPEAAPAAEPTPEPPSEPGWSLGAGVGGAALPAPLLTAATTSGAIGLLGLGGLGTTSAPAVPNASLMLERRLGPTTWLLASVSFATGSSSGDSTAPPADYTVTTQQNISSTSAALALGLRQRFAAIDRFEVSWFAVVVGTGAFSSGTLANSTNSGGTTTKSMSQYDSQAYAVGASAGFALDLKLMDRLMLRFSTPLADFGYSRSISYSAPVGGSTATAPQTSNASGLSGGVTFAPTLALRLLL